MIPRRNASGVIPPLSPGEAGASRRRSPYPASVEDVVHAFGTSWERVAILRGLLEYRAELRELGLGGFQWLDGSFFERVEATRGRPPKDIDVVSFCELGDGPAQKALIKQAPGVVDRNRVSREFQVDAYFVNLSRSFDRVAARNVAYWYSMWSHRRGDGMWKGFVEVSLAGDDGDAMSALDALTEGFTSISGHLP